MSKYITGKYGLVNNRYFLALMCVYFNIQVAVYGKMGQSTMVLISVLLLSLANSNVTVNQEKINNITRTLN